MDADGFALGFKRPAAQNGRATFTGPPVRNALIACADLPVSGVGLSPREDLGKSERENLVLLSALALAWPLTLPYESQISEKL